MKSTRRKHYFTVVYAVIIAVLIVISCRHDTEKPQNLH